MKPIRSLFVILWLCLFALLAATPSLFAVNPVITVPAANYTDTIKVGGLFSLTLTATDADAADTVGWSVSGLLGDAAIVRAPQPAVAGPRTCAFTWTPATAALGSNVVTFTASNTTTTALSVDYVGAAVTATLVSVSGLVVGSTITFNNTVNTPETVVLTVVNTGTRVVTWVGALTAGYSAAATVVTYVPFPAVTRVVTLVVVAPETAALLPYDTVANTAINIPLLKVELAGFDGDTLISVRVESRIEKEYAISKITLWKNAEATPFKSYNVTGRFDENYDAILAGFNKPFDGNDTLTIKVDAWTDSVDTDTTYHMSGLEIVIPPEGLIFKHGPAANTPVFADNYIANPSIDPATGLWAGPPDYIVLFDLYAPIYDVSVTVLDTTTVPNVCASIVNIGDSIAIVVNNPNELIASNSVRVNLSKFGGSATHALNYHAGGVGFADDTWTDTIRVASMTLATGLDVIAGYVIYFTAVDNAGNTGTVQYQFTEPIDDIAPKFDSLKFYISGNYTGSDTSAALGDKLTIVAYLTSNGFFEISSVTAVDTWNNFRSDTTAWVMDDVTNGNNQWRVDIWLTNPLPIDYPVGDTIFKHIYLTAIDNACNSKTDSLNFLPAIDIEPPTWSTAEYQTIANLDSSGCTNLGDSVRVVADLTGNDDIERVYADFLHAGINGSNEEDLVDLGTGEWARRWKIGSLTDPTLDPDPLYSRGADNVPVHASWNDYTVMLYVLDDAGNLDSLRTTDLTAVVGGGTVPLDTRRPSAIVVDDATINKLPAGKLQLKWPAAYPSQAGDATWFYIYVDSTGTGFDYTKVFGTTFNTEYSADTNAWTSEYLTDSKTYRFVVRTKDNCGNPEFNTNMFQAEADAKAPIACVVFPDTGKYYGPDKPLNITATTTNVDLDSAWITYRRLDVPSGTWGAWLNWRGTNYMTVAGQTLYENVALGTAAATKGYYELYILTKDLAGNVLLLDSAEEHCDKFSFFWNPDVLAADVVSINGATSPQTNCGFDVWRDSVNTAVVTVTGPVADSVYTIDSWVIFYDVTNRDSVRIEFKDLQAVPFTYTFSVYDWPKSPASGGLNTTLYVRITDTRNGSAGIDSARLCVPDVVAPDIFMTYPTAYSRVPIAKSSLNTVPVKAKISALSYDPDSPVRVEFFYALDAATLTWVKIGEDGLVLESKGFTGSTALIANPFPEFEVAWDNSLLAEGFVWLKAIVHDNVDNTKEAAAIKVYLDKTAPLMTLTMPDALMINGKLTIVKPDEDEFVNLVAEITNNTIDIASVDFFVSYRDSVDLAKFYHLIGNAYAGTNNSIWRYEWGMDEYPWSGTAGSTTLTSSASISDDHVHLASVAGIVPGTPVTLDNSGGGPSSALNGTSETLIVDHVSGTTVYFESDLTLNYDSGDDAIWLGAWFKCGYDYKLRVKVTDIAGNVYDDMDGDGQFDDYTFWSNPFVTPITLSTPADLSKLIFNLDCGAPQVAIYEVGAGGRTYQTPSSILGGPAEVYLKKGETLTIQSIVLDSLNELGGVKKVQYFFKSENGAYASVGFATASPFGISFDPFALGMITDADVRINEDQGSIKAVLTDSLGQTTQDVITCWTLDIFPGDSKWKTPTMPYVWGDVDLSIWLLNGDEYYRQVVYKYKPTAGGEWTTIETVLRNAGASDDFDAEWPTLNQVTDGSYILGFETTDQNLNVKAIADNPQITVIVQNALPTVAISSPTDGEFFCVEPYFTADATNGPVGAVDFQYKEVTDAGWTAFPDPSDNFPPFGKYFVLDHEDSLSDGYYHFRAYATNQAGRTAYSTPITLFYDGTAPLARLTKLDAEGDFADIEYNNDGSVSVDKAAGTLNITAVAFDTLSAVGAQAIYNSGVAWVGLYFTGPSGPGAVELAKEYPDPADSGYYTFTWNISGLATGQYKLAFEAWDKTGCNVGEDTRTVYLHETVIPTSLVAGFWQPVPGQGKIVGVTFEDESVQFQYKQTGDWIPIGIGRDEGVDKSLFYPDQRWQTYSVYSAEWAPADGAYQLRMLTGYGEDYSPVLSVTIAGGVMTAVDPTTGTWGPGTIEKNQEEGCELQGVARFASTFGFPFAVSISMDLDDLNFEYELVDFRNLPQQTPVANYAGPFQFTEMEDGGPAWGQVFFCDNVGTVGYSYGQHLAAYWITQDLGTGGPITYVSVNLKDTTTVTIPPEWNDDIDGYDDALVIWESSKPAQCVWLDWLLTPVGNRSGLSNYVGAPGDNCVGDNEGEGDDERYAIIKMTYDATCNIPQESLMVAWWDGEGDWQTQDIFFPSTVSGFNTVNHTVEFAATNLHGTYAVIKRTPNVCQEIVTRKDALPMCGGQYTNGYPVFWYQFVEAFTYEMDWTTLQVKVDGILVYDGGNIYVNGVKVAPNTALDDEARHWDIDIDAVSAVVSVKYSPPDEGVLDDPLPLACGAHTIWISAKDSQLRGQCMTDPFVVDCTKPVVTFPNSYVGKDPTITFTITDDLAGVEWDSVYADVFFITKTDSADYYGDYYTKERVAFMQTFFPGQIENYLSGNTVTIPTSYNLENVRAIIVVVYNGHRRTNEDPDNWGIDPTNNYFDEYYMVNAGAPDCVGNNATPHVQYFTVDAKAPSITQTKNDCPMMFTIADDGSGISASDIVIREDGIALSSSAQQSTASAVNGGGKWFFAPSGGGGVLYYCPTAGAKAEIAITDGVGNEGVKLVGPVGPIADGDLTVTMSNNPFDPAVEHLTLYITLKKTATVTAKIYDMGGDLVRTLSPMVGENLYWDGKTEGGTTIVANGVYLAHIVAEGSGGSVSTVVKIAVVKK